MNQVEENNPLQSYKNDKLNKRYWQKHQSKPFNLPSGAPQKSEIIPICIQTNFILFLCDIAPNQDYQESQRIQIDIQIEIQNLQVLRDTHMTYQPNNMYIPYPDHRGRSLHHKHHKDHYMDL